MKQWQRTAVTLAGAAALGLLAVGGAASQEPARERERERGGRVEAVAEYLQLSPQQRAAWEAALETHRADTEPLREEGRALRERLREALATENADPTQVGEAALALRQHRELLKSAREQLESQLKALLSPEQQTRFEAFKAARQLDRPGRRSREPGERRARQAPVEG